MPVTGSRHRTMLSIPEALAEELRALAATRRCSVNALLVEASEALILAYRAKPEAQTGESQSAGGIQTSLAIRRDLDAVDARLAALEAYVHGRTTATTPDGEREILDAAGVRREARRAIEERGRPIPHRELLDILQRRFVLPGLNPSENLRTILVHPKATGFAFTRGSGYSVHDTEGPAR